MLLLSVAVHLVVAALGVAWVKWGARPILQITPVTVVDLVGFVPAAPRPAPPAAPPEPARTAPRGKKSAPPKSKEPARRKEKAPPEVEHGMAPPDKKPAAEEVANAIRRIRDTKAASEQLKKTLEEKQRIAEAKKAIDDIRDRAARKVDLLAAVRPMGRAGFIDNTGNPRLSSEQLEYARALDERIRSRWTQPVENAHNLVAVLVITIERDGKVSKTEMEKTSGNPRFDEAVLRAIRTASPLPVPPEALRGFQTYYVVGFRFYGSGGAL
jgi:colicin import membrane protein